jgi:tetratricopeptide (TPR) repeat protein
VTEQQTEAAALAAASLLAAGTVDEQGGQAGVGAWVGHARLAGLVQRAVTDGDVATVLDEVTARPQDPAAIGVLAQVLAAMADEDRRLAGELARLVGQAEHDPVISGLATTIAGHARVGKVVTIGHAGSVHVHLPPPPPQTLLDRLHRATASGPLAANLPPRNPAFTGRQDLLDRLHASLRPGKAAAVVQAHALHGLGGVGKTQLALEYAYRHVRDYDLIWWVVAEQPAAIPGQLVALARRLGIPEATEQAETVQVLWDELRQRDRWLLILDNAEGPDTPTGLGAPLARLADLLPRMTGGHVLVTSRDASWDQHVTLAELEIFTPDEAVVFLLARSGSNDQATAGEIAELLGWLPLALEQAGAYVHETSTSLAIYLDRLRQFPALTLTKGRPRDRRPTDTVATTWQVSLERVVPIPGAVALLELCAYLAPDQIPRTLFAQQLDPPLEDLAVLAGDPFALDEAIAALRRYALVRASENSLTTHRLLQQVVRDRLRLDPEARATRAAGAIRLLEEAFPGEGYRDPGIWPICEWLLPHAITASDHAEHIARQRVDQGEHPEQEGVEVVTAWLLTWAGGYLYVRARYKDAQALLTRSLALKDAFYGANQPDAVTVNYLGLVLRAQGDLGQARTHCERALTIDEANYGPEHPAVATTINNLAGVLRDQGDLEGARRLHERALAIFEARLGADHPDTARSLNNLATVLAAQGDLEGARTLFERALAIREARLGPDHPRTATSLNNLAGVLADQGDLAGARPLLERALAIREARLGPNDPTVGRDRDRLGDVLRQLGDLTGARAQYERALAIAEAVLGPDDVQVAAGLYNLAGLLQDLNELSTAREKLKRALAIDEAAYGPDHPEVATDLTALGGVVAAQGDLEGARALFERALAIREARLGADHPDTATSLNNLALVLRDQGDLDAARTLLERALAIYEARLGADHPDTVGSREDLATVVAELDE